MRPLPVLLVLASIPLAGCIQADEGPADPLLGWCPQWDQGPGWLVLDGALDASEKSRSQSAAPPEGAGDAFQWRNLTLDVYRIDVERVEVSGGTLELRAVDADRDRPAILRDHRFPPGSQIQVLARFQEDTQGPVLEAALNPVDRQEGLHSGPLRLEWSLDGPEGAWAAFSVNVTFHYRVCGARV